MPEIQIDNIGTIPERAGVAIVDNVADAKDLLVRQHIGLVEENAPDDLGVGIIVPDGGHDLIADPESVLIQLEVAAIGENVQRGTDLLLILIPQRRDVAFYPLVQGADAGAEEREFIVNGGLGQRVHQHTYIRFVGRSRVASAHQLHLPELRQERQHLGGLGELFPRQGGEIDGNGVLRIAVAAELHMIEKLRFGRGGGKRLQLFGSQMHLIQLNAAKLLQKGKTGEQPGKFIAAKIREGDRFRVIFHHLPGNENAVADFAFGRIAERPDLMKLQIRLRQVQRLKLREHGHGGEERVIVEAPRGKRQLPYIGGYADFAEREFRQGLRVVEIGKRRERRGRTIGIGCEDGVGRGRHPGARSVPGSHAENQKHKQQSEAESLKRV